MTAFARPDPAHNFKGKIGVWRVAVQVPYKTGVRAAQGVKRWVDTTLRACSYTDDDNIRIKGFRDYIQLDVMPAIRKAMPWMKADPKTGRKAQTIYLQIDGASPHTGQGTVEWLNRDAISRADGFHIETIVQPARSPDTNLNDLAFYRALNAQVKGHVVRRSRPHRSDRNSTP